MDTTVLLGLIKWLFPSLTGSVFAVYYKAKEIGWESIDNIDKWKLVFIVVGAVLAGVFMAYLLGGALVEFWEVTPETKIYMIIYFICGFSGVKLLDALAENVNSWIDKLIEIITLVIDKFTGKFK